MTKLFIRPDGLRTRIVNGYDMADLICQNCVKDHHNLCASGSHEFIGYAACPCNCDEELQPEGGNTMTEIPEVVRVAYQQGNSFVVNQEELNLG